MFDQVPFNWFEAIAQDTLAAFDNDVSRILFNVEFKIWCAQLELDRAMLTAQFTH